MRGRLTLALLAATAAGACDDGQSGDATSDAAMADAARDDGATDAAPDAGRQPSDAATDDGGPIADGAPPALDAGTPDAGTPDAGTPDAGTPDAAVPDAGDPPGGFRPAYPIAADFTEGGIYDPTGHAFFVGSLATGGVYRVDADTGAQSTLFEPQEPGLWWSLGMDVDVAANRLYVCAMDDRRELDEDHDFVGYLWGFDLETGERVVDRALTDAAEGATCTDVAVAADGTVYVNDRENPRLYRFDPAGALALIVENDDLGGGIVGQNALVVLPDQSALLSLIYLPSRLVRVSLPDLEVTEVEIDGDFFDGLPALSGADGMTLSGDSVLVAFTSQVNRLRPVVADWTRVTSTTVDVPVGMTDIVHTPEGDYLLNGQSVRFALGQDPEPSQLVRFDGDL